MPVMAKKPPVKNETPPARADDGFKTRSFRLPAELLAAFEADARRNKRTTNSHVEWLIEQYLSGKLKS